MTRLGNYYALHIMAFCNALYQRAGPLRAVADEFTNSPLKSLVEALTTIRAFGGEVHMIAQSRSEIIRKFGEQQTLTIEENAVQSSLGSDSASAKTQTNLSLTKQRVLTPAELMKMPPTEQLVHIKGVGFFIAKRWSLG